ncbi:MAG: tRNA preQ1(34) S-adenosylmethionine ribosyltransferase-isomerase QueA [bacterium]|nr:tRNA preQ1(34) S-adenosylmethionine ribosyltransferase-isomerase QueA [bacterium]
MKTADLDYILPEEQIAQTPVVPRESAKLLAINRANKTRQHLHVSDLPNFFTPNDCLVLNVTSVLRARLYGRLTRTGSSREIFLVQRVGDRFLESPQRWQALVRGHVKIGERIIFTEGVAATIDKANDDGTFYITFSSNPEKFDAFLAQQGHVPVPPYIHTEPVAQDYETVYADPKERRSVAAPTAGFHLTTALLEKLKQKGVQIEKVVLDVGLGTFRPVRSENLEDHKIHAEKIYVSEETAVRINEAKKAGKRIVAVGTTTLRVLESVANQDGTIKSFVGDTSLFITPGYKFKVVDALLTNFHLPKSSLLALVATFIGTVDETLSLYNEAVKNKYRFFSFGDAMWIE